MEKTKSIVLTREMYDIDLIPKEYKYLFGTNVYKLSKRGGGFYKFRILSIKMDTELESQIISLVLKGTHWKQKAKPISINFAFEGGVVFPLRTSWFTSLPELFLLNQDLYNLKKSAPSNFIFELKQMQHKYPEYFL